MIRHKKRGKKKKRIPQLDNKYVNDNFTFHKKDLSNKLKLSYKRFHHYINDDGNIAIIYIRERKLIDLLEAEDSSKCLVLNSDDKIEKVMNFRSYRIDFADATHDIVMQDENNELKRHELVKINRNHYVISSMVNNFARSEKTVYCSEGSTWPVFIAYKKNWWLVVPPINFEKNEDAIVPIGEREIKDKSEMKKIN